MTFRRSAMKKRTLLRSLAAMPLAFPLMSSARETPAPGDHFTAASRIADVEADPAFKGFGRLLFPLESRYRSGTTLGDISLDWYSEIRVANTVAVFNFLKREAESGIPVLPPDQLQKRFVGAVLLKARHQSVVVHRIEELRGIYFHDDATAAFKAGGRLPDRVMRTASRTESIAV